MRRKFDALDHALREEVVRAGLTAAAEPIVQTARHNAPGSRIPRDIKLVGIRAERDGTVTATVGIRTKARAFHGLFVELGTGPRVQRKTGRLTGSMPAKPFLRPAFDTEKGRALSAFSTVIQDAIKRATNG